MFSPPDGETPSPSGGLDSVIFRESLKFVRSVAVQASPFFLNLKILSFVSS